MTWDRADSADSQDAEDTASPAFFRSKRSGAMSGSAPITSWPVRPLISPPLILTLDMRTDLHQAEARQAFHEAMLMGRREALAATARHLRDQSRCKEASLAMAELLAVTNEILAQGARQ